MDSALFFGRFHPLVVHLPIGFLLLAAVFEWLSRKSKYHYLKQAVPITLLLGAISAILSVLLGLLIAGDKGYDEGSLFWHRWLGILVAAISVALWLLKAGYFKAPPKTDVLLFVAVILLISFTGHLGGELTHGEGYLTQYAPTFVKRLAGNDQSEGSYLSDLPAHPDSVKVFADMISPMLTLNCMPCHNESQKKGGLALHTYQAMVEGGESGPSVVAGKPLASELFKRITLPTDHAKFMPLKKKPLSFSEVSLIEWWIAAGAPAESTLSDMDVPEPVSDLLMRDFNYDITPKPYYEITTVAAVSDEKLAEPGAEGLIIRKLSEKNNYLDVSVLPSVTEITAAQLDALAALKENITWLNLNGKIKDPALVQKLAQFENLTRLNIGNNPIKDEHITSLTSLTHLEALNLYGTEITDQSLDALTAMNSLRKLYLWQTKISEEGIGKLSSQRSSLEVVKGGFQFE